MTSLHLYQLKLACRWSLGFVWIWEGLVLKILWPGDPRQIPLVEASGLYWPDPETFLLILGIGMTALGILLCTGWKERATVLVASLAMTALIVLVVGNAPELLADLDAGIAKDASLYAAAWTVWTLSPVVPKRPPRSPAAATVPANLTARSSSSSGSCSRTRT